MTGIDRLMCRAAAAVLLAAILTTPAKAQFGGGDGGQDMMTQMAPMLEMMKAKMGKRRFTQLMQTMGPMMSGMMENGGGFGGMMGGGGMNFASLGGMGGGFGGMDGFDGGQMMAMIPQLMTMANFGGGGRHYRRGRRHPR